MNNVLEQRDWRSSRGPAWLRFGPDRVVAQLGRGGMAAVYSAVHFDTNHAVALKVLPPDLPASIRAIVEAFPAVPAASPVEESRKAVEDRDIIQDRKFP